jgi:hypothetical protein
MRTELSEQCCGVKLGQFCDSADCQTLVDR